MMLCCFRGLPDVTERPPTPESVGGVATATVPKAVGTVAGTCRNESPDELNKKITSMVASLRYRLAAAQGPWPSRVQSCANYMLAACTPVAHVSLFGASPCGTVLVSLGSASRCPPLAVLSPGQVLAAPPSWLGDSTECGVAVAPPSAAHSGALVMLEGPGAAVHAAARTGEPSVLVWQELASCGEKQGPAPGDPVNGRASGLHRPPANPINLTAPPDDWAPLLRALARDTATAEAAPGSGAGEAGTGSGAPFLAVLVPLRLGSDLIGGMLLLAVQATAVQANAAAAAAAAAATGDSSAAEWRQPEPWFRDELLSGVAAAVSECCVGPHVSEIRRVTAASYELAAALDVQNLASILSNAVQEDLATEIHVDFAVRLALVPQATGVRTALPHCGFLLTEQPPAAPLGGALASELLARTSTHGSAARMTAARILTQHSHAERTLTLSGVKVGPSATSLDVASGCFGPQPGLLSSGVHSFMLPTTCPRRNGVDAQHRSWKARPFSLESTLLASLLSKAARAPGGTLGQVPSAAGAGFGSAAPSMAYDDPAGALGIGGGCGGGTPESYLRVPTAAHLAAATVGGGVVSCAAAVPLLAGGGGSCSLFRVCRTGGAIIPHVHAYVNDTDQPSGDVMLLLRSATPAAGAGGAGCGLARPRHPSMAGNASFNGAAAATATGAPASLVMVMGSVALLTMDSLIRGSQGDDGSVTMSRPATGTSSRQIGLAGVKPSPSPVAATPVAAALWPSAAAAAGGGGDGNGSSANGISVCVALYLTSQERLPASLLAAARSRALLLLELLLPAMGACLAESAAAELLYMYDTIAGALNGGIATSAAALLGRAASLPASRPQGRSPWSRALPSEEPPLTGGGSDTAAGGSGGGPLITPVDAVAAAVSTTASVGNLLPLSATAVPSQVPGTTAAVTLNGGSGGGGGTVLQPRGSPQERGLVSALYCRTGGAVGGMGISMGIGASQETLDGDCRALAQLLSSPQSNRQSALDGPSTLVSGASATQHATITLPSPGGPHTREASENSVRVPRSRLSHATAYGNPAGTPATIQSGNAAFGNNLFNSYNSLVAALMGTGSVTGKVPGPGGGAGGGTELYGTADPMQSGNTLPGIGTSMGFTPPASRPSTVQRRVPMQQLPLPLAHAQGGLMSTAGAPPLLMSPASGLGSRGGYRAHRPPRRHFSELLTSMPLDMSDTLTVMRSNMDVLVSSFWNTLRSQNNDPSPSPHADEDLRFLRLIKVLGGGGCSTVYTGILHGLEVAVKVMKAPSVDEEDEEEDAPSPRQQRQQAKADSEEGGGNAPEVAVRKAQLRAIMRGARELAVMTSISHPNIVQIYSHHTRVLVLAATEEEQSERPAGGGGGGEGGGAAAVAPDGEGKLPRLVPVPPDSTTSLPGPLQTVLIMECCDLGSLADALDSGMFASAIRNAESARWSSRHGRPRRSQTLSQLSSIPADASLLWGDGGGGNNGSSRQGCSRSAGVCFMRAIYLTLLEVALALRHLHFKNLVHCDVKPANVLLKSSASDPRGFTCKLTDFGFVNLLQYQLEDVDDPAARPCMRYHEPVGTVTHLAPETMVQGSKLDHTVDIFAFGILMWEVFTGKAPYAEHASNNFRDVPYRVVREGMRPVFPSATPPAFRALAQACWEADASRRPSAAVLVASLQRLMDAAARG